MKKYTAFVLSLLMICCVASLFAQDGKLEVDLKQNPFKKKAHKPVMLSVGAGSMYYWGDLSEGFDPTYMRPSVNMGLYYYVLPQLSFRAGFLAGTIYANDDASKYLTHKARNLHFRSRIYEFSGVLVYEIFKNQNLASKYFYKIGKLFSPYFFGGAALFYFNPQAEYMGQWIDLQPLGTEGQNITNWSISEPIETGYPEPYDLWAFAIPFGGGVKFNFSKSITFSFEAGVRKTFTDYLDDVSTFYPDYSKLQNAPNGNLAVLLSDRGDNSLVDGISAVGAIRGNPDIKDWYFDFGFSIAYHINWRKGLGL